MEKYKKYNAKVYKLDWTYKFTINPQYVKSDINLSTQINWWQNELKLIFNLDNVDIENTDIIKVYEITENYTNWILVYTWIVQNVIKRITNASYEVELPLLWLASIFTYKIYNWTRDEEPADMVKYFIAQSNLDYNLFSYWDIQNYWTTLNIEFDNKNFLECLNTIAEATWFYFYINADWTIDFKPKDTEPTHKLTLWKDVDNLELFNDTEELVNKLTLEWDGWTTIYEDTTSQWIYWVREKFISKTDLQDQVSADEYWNNYITNNKNPKSSTKIKININFNWIIRVWQNISVLNTKLDIKNKQIVRASYSRDYINIELEKYETFWKQFY